MLTHSGRSHQAVSLGTDCVPEQVWRLFAVLTAVSVLRVLGLWGSVGTRVLYGAG